MTGLTTIPNIDYIMSYVLDNDPSIPPPPPDLQGKFLKPEYISVFAQSQKSADLPMIERYVETILGVGQANAEILDKLNVDRLADIYSDRLFIPYGLNVPDSEVAIQREERARAQAQQDQQEYELEVAKSLPPDVIPTA